MAAPVVLEESSGPMKRSKFSEEQIVYAIRQADAGTPVGDLCRQLGVSDATFYAWKKKYSYLGESELRRLRQLEEENSRLKRLAADLSLDKHMLSEALRKNLRPAHHRELTRWFQGTVAVSCARAFRLAQFGRASWYRRSRAKDQSALRMRIRDLAHARPRFGYLRIWVFLRREGWRVNRNECAGCTGSKDCSCACGSGSENIRPCTGAPLPRQRGRPSGGVWILCMIPWPMGGPSGS